MYNCEIIRDGWNNKSARYTNFYKNPARFLKLNRFVSTFVHLKPVLGINSIFKFQNTANYNFLNFVDRLVHFRTSLPAIVFMASFIFSAFKNNNTLIFAKIRQDFHDEPVHLNTGSPETIFRNKFVFSGSKYSWLQL